MGKDNIIKGEDMSPETKIRNSIIKKAVVEDLIQKAVTHRKGQAIIRSLNMIKVRERK